MKWFIASDIHGSAYYCEKMLDAFRREKADRMLLLGDLLYHGPRNDLPKEYDTTAVTAMLTAYKEQITAVRGNCDAEVDQWVLSFPILADFTLIHDAPVPIFATHGHLYNETSLPPLTNGTVLLHGHTHTPKCVPHENYVYMNPGSVSLPKDNTPRGYMVYENSVFIWKDLDGEEYMRHQIEGFNC